MKIIKTVQYSIEWLVPAKNAIGGTAYWDCLKLNRQGSLSTGDEQQARRFFANLADKFQDDHLRLVQSIEEVQVLEVCQPHTKPDLMFSGSTDQSPFTVSAFTDETESDCLGTQTVNDWADVSAIGQKYIDSSDEAYVMVTDREKRTIDPDKWLCYQENAMSQALKSIVQAEDEHQRQLLSGWAARREPLPFGESEEFSFTAEEIHELTKPMIRHDPPNLAHDNAEPSSDR